MAEGIRKNGILEVRFSEDRTQALATIYPPRGDGDQISAADVVERLKAMGINYGIREHGILEAVHYAEETNMPAVNFVVAQGAVPENGKDAKVTYTLPMEEITKPLPKRADNPALPDWFALSATKLVKAGAELASIIPPQPGTPGKTLTWPIQSIPPKAGKPAGLTAGAGVRFSEDGMHLCADQDGYVCLNGEQMVVHALRQIEENTTGGQHVFPAGAVFAGNLQKAEVTAGAFIAVKGVAMGCRLRAHGDVFLRYAENCSIIASGTVYVAEGLKNCEVNTRQKLVAFESAQISGGVVAATEGVSATSLGTPNFTITEVEVAVDRYSDYRNQEITQELSACEANITRITQALKPFSSMAVHEGLTDDKRQLLQRLQHQKQSQEVRIKDLYNERRSLTMAAKQKVTAAIVVTGTTHPGVMIRIRDAAMQVETPMEAVRFVEGAGSRSVQLESLEKAA